MQHHWQYKRHIVPGLKIFKTIIVLFLTTASYGQTQPSYPVTKKGQLYILWGWNRGSYTKSNIHFRGNDYAFTLYKVKAHDRPTRFSYYDYLKFSRLTTPQTDFRLGYFIKNNIAVSLGFDHMKYVMDQDQVVKMKGTIEHAGAYKGVYDGDKKLTADFLKYEHTNGLNYINIEGEKFGRLYQGKKERVIIHSIVGVGAGFLFPRTDATLMDYQRNDEFHVSGFGLDAKAGIQVTLFRHFIVKLETKCGYINMPDVRLHKKGIKGRAKQAFWFNETDGMIGATFSFGNKKRSNQKTKVNYAE